MFLTLARKVIHSHRAKRIEAMHGQPQWCKVPAGFWMYIDPSEWLGKTLLMGYYESHLVFLISQVCQRGDVCVDIGANQGYISLQMARRVGTEGCVLAIEPIEPTFERLVGNIQRNRASQVHCIHRAAGACVQSLEIWYDPSESGPCLCIQSSLGASHTRYHSSRACGFHPRTAPESTSVGQTHFRQN
jgi:hypothetical protein